MARTTGWVLAMGGITMFNQSVLNGQEINWKVPVATAISAGLFALLEKAWPEGAVGVAAIALVSVLFVRLDKNTKAPAETLLEWME